MFTKGSTAMDFSFGTEGGFGAGLSLPLSVPCPNLWKINKPKARSAITAISAVSLRPVLRLIDLPGSISSVRTIPSGVISNAQASTSAIGKPRIVSKTTALVMAPGRCKAGTTVAATCITSQATTA